MIKKFSSICILAFCVLLLISCDYDKEKEDNSMTYQLKLRNDSEELNDLVRHYTSSSLGYYLFSEDEANIYARKNLSNDEKTIEYYQYSDEQLKSYYRILFGSEMLKEDFQNLRKSKEVLFRPIEDKSLYHLPDIEMLEGNVLSIQTNEGKIELDLAKEIKEYDVRKEDELIFDIVALNENNIHINIHNHSMDDPMKRNSSIFVSQDLQHILVTQTYTEKFLEDIVNGNLSPHEDLLIELDTEGRFVKAANSHVIVDTVEKRLVEINSDDYVSDDYELVYINGNKDPLLEGKQQIQTIGNYLVGNTTYEKEFTIDYKEISKQREFKSSGNVSIGKVTYFHNDYIILFLNFKLPFTGTAGSTNVIVDFQEDKENPTYYILDLGLQ